MSRRVGRPACAWAVALTVTCACGAPAANAPHPPDDRAVVLAFAREEARVLDQLAAIDARLATRGRHTPSERSASRLVQNVLLAGDARAAIVDGELDPFSFDARAHALANVATDLAKLPTTLPESQRGEPLARPALERALLVRLVDEERARVGEERALGRSGELLRAVVATWTSPTPTSIAARDQWLERRFGELAARLETEGAQLSTAEARELDDRLDAIERLLGEGFPGAMKRLVELRDAIEQISSRAATSAPAPVVDGRRPTNSRTVESGLAVHFGVTTLDAIEPLLDAAALRLTHERDALGVRTDLQGDVLRERVTELVFAHGACFDEVPDAPVRAMGTSPEREGICHLRHAFARAASNEEARIALSAALDLVTIGRWALAQTRGVAIDTATAKTPLTPPNPAMMTRFERMAVARTVVAIGSAVAIALLTRGELQARARMWNAFGDAPLDVVAPAVGDARFPITRSAGSP